MITPPVADNMNSERQDCPAPIRMMCPATIRIGTRGTPLAVAQAMEVKNRLLGSYPEVRQEQIEIVKIVTTGDRIQDRPLVDIGGKGLFTKEIEEALHSGAVDMAVHSMKDMPDTFPDGLIIECILEREDPRDALITRDGMGLDALPDGAIVGTSSVRRKSQLLRYRPDLQVVPIRGSVNTRIKKLHNGQAEATLLAVAGLKRLNRADEVSEVLLSSVMLPAVAQGAIGVECLSENTHIREVLSAINHEASNVRVTAERGFLKALGGSCATPIAALAEFQEDGTLFFRGVLASMDGKEFFEATRVGVPEDADAMGREAGEELLAQGKHLLVEAA